MKIIKKIKYTKLKIVIIIKNSKAILYKIKIKIFL